MQKKDWVQLFQKIKMLKIRENAWFIFLLLMGTFTWSLTMLKSGLIYGFGMGFWGANGHDGVWHIALSEALARGSTQMPIFSGNPIQNYHLGFDLILAALHRITAIPVVNLYFQVIPPVLALMVGLFTYKLVHIWTKDKIGALWSTYFVYFGSGLGFLVTLLRNEGIGGESMFWAQQAISTLINPPFTLSLVFILLGFIFLLKDREKSSKVNRFLAIAFFGLVIQIKAYGGILVLGGLGIGGLYEYIRRKSTDVLFVFIGATLLSAVIFLPTLKEGETFLIFQPFWFLETLIAASDRFFWPKMAEAMLAYKTQSVISKFALAYGLSFLIFIVGNFGIRLLGILKPIDEVRRKKLSWVTVSLSSVIVGGIILPILFLQKGTSWNTIQFLYYALFFAGIYTGITVSNLLRKTRGQYRSAGKYLLTGAIILLTLPTTVGALGHYLPAVPPAAISRPEIEALNFLAGQKNGITLTYPFNRAGKVASKPTGPKPLYLYASTAYVAAFGKKDVFLEDVGNVDLLGYDPEPRLKEVENFLDNKDVKNAKEFLDENKITYIYWLKDQKANLSEKELGLTKIFDNKEVTIYKYTGE